MHNNLGTYSVLEYVWEIIGYFRTQLFTQGGHGVVQLLFIAHLCTRRYIAGKIELSELGSHNLPILF